MNQNYIRVSHNARVSVRHFLGIIGPDHPDVSPPEMPVTSSEKPRGGRPATGRGVPYTFRSPETLQDEFFRRVGGSRRAPAVFRQFMRAYVGEPGATMPKPPPATAEEAA